MLWYFFAFFAGYALSDLLDRQYVKYVKQSKDDIWAALKISEERADRNFEAAIHYKSLYEHTRPDNTRPHLTLVKKE